MKAFDTVTSKVNCVGPTPKLRGMGASPGRGWGLKTPYGVATAPSFPASASAGRSANTESPLLSPPVVILNGSADVSVTNWYTEKSSGKLIEPPTDTR